MQVGFGAGEWHDLTVSILIFINMTGLGVSKTVMPLFSGIN